MVLSRLDRYVGLAYQDKGRDFDGVDCWGLVYLLYKTLLGVYLPSYDNEYRSIDDRERADLEKVITDNYCGWDKVAKPQKYDAVLLTVGGVNCHIGVTIDHGQMLHIQRGQTSVIENYQSAKWAQRVYGFYRYRHIV